MEARRLSTTFILLNILNYANCANILFITPVLSPSHHIWSEVLVEGLLSKGHNITLYGNDKPTINSKNYTVIQIEGMYKKVEYVNVTDFGNMDPFKVLLSMWEFADMICEHSFESNALKVLLSHPKNAFDLIIMDVGNSHCFYPLIDIFGRPPVMGMSPVGLTAQVSTMMGDHIYSYIPCYVSTYSGTMSLGQRFWNTLLHNFEYLTKKYMFLPSIYKKAQKYFGQNIRYFEEIERNITLMLTNIDNVLDYPQPIPPNIIPIGGLTTRPSKKLPQDLQNIMDNAKDGVIYLSLGTNVKQKFIGHAQKQALFDAFAKLPQIVLCKFTKEENLNIPDNVVLRKFFPQNDILGHKNLKLFITHGGSFSTKEATYHGVPVVGLPIFLDQENNIEKIVSKKLGKRLDVFRLTSENIYATIQEVLNNTMYRNNMESMSKKFRDQPQTPLDRAIFWIEYVLRHGEANHFNIAAKDMNVVETLHLDIIGFILFLVYLITFILAKLFQTISNLIKRQSNVKVKKN